VIAEFSVALQMERLLAQVRQDDQGVYEKWVEIGKKLAQHRSDPSLHAKEHLDGNVDIILRALEANQLLAFQNFGQMINGGSFHLQVSLSKMWLFAIYETVRTNCSFKPCAGQQRESDYCDLDDCFRCKLRTVKDRLSFFRMPLAKLEPESCRGVVQQKNYQPEQVIDEDNGSFGWRATSEKTKTTEVTSRLLLSDFVLETLLGT
jgi:hypothetical protein